MVEGAAVINGMRMRLNVRSGGHRCSQDGGGVFLVPRTVYTVLKVLVRSMLLVASKVMQDCL